MIDDRTRVSGGASVRGRSSLRDVLRRLIGIAFAVSATARVRIRESLLTVAPRHRSHWSPISLRRIAQDRLPKSHLVLTASDSVGSALLAVSATRRVRIRESLLTL